MKKTLAVLLYTGLAMLANPALADLAKAEAMREGDMKKLTFHSTAQPAGTAEFRPSTVRRCRLRHTRASGCS